MKNVFIYNTILHVSATVKTGILYKSISLLRILWHFSYIIYVYMGTAVAQWLRCCATNRKVAGSILAGVIGIFH